jgi:spermidine synthase
VASTPDQKKAGIKTVLSVPQSRLLLIAFIEGATVMAVELLGAKMAAPFFGTSLYAWAGVLAVTLLALAGGYFLGGFLTTRYDSRKLLIAVLLVAGFTTALMRFSAPAVMKALIDSSITTGVLVSLCVYLLPPILCYGMVSPIIIRMLVDRTTESGTTSGKVFAVSTLGGVINTLVFGFVIIPEFGIGKPTLMSGALVALLPLLLRPNVIPIAGALMIIAFAFMKATKKQESPTGMIRMVYASEGLMGQVKVTDFGWTEPGYLNNQLVRCLFVNNTTQTMVTHHDGTSLLTYIWFIKPLLSRYGKGDKTLLIGLGGGALAKAIHERALDLRVVEIDERLPELARTYFGLPPEIETTVDDGRHFIRKTQENYNLIIFDAFLGENPPWQLLTTECFRETRERLLPGGMLVIEFYGFIEGKRGVVGRSVYRTLQSAGFENVEIIATAPRDGLERNLIFVASDVLIDFDSLDYRQTVYREPIGNLKDFMLDKTSLDTTDALLLTDDRPVLDKLLARPAMEWRESLNERFRNQFIRENKPLFY